MFASTIGKYQKKLIFLWCLVATIAMASQFYVEADGIIGHFQLIVAYSSIWLLGYCTIDLAKHFNVNAMTAFAWLGLLPIASRIPYDGNFYMAFKHLIVGITVIPLLLHLVQKNNSSSKSSFGLNYIFVFVLVYAVLLMQLFATSNSLIMSKFFYASTPFFVLLVVRLINRSKLLTSLFLSTSLFLGYISYALYLFHYPVFYISGYLGGSGMMTLFVLLPTVILMAYISEVFIHPYLRGILFLRLRY